VERRALGVSGIEVSALSLGSWRTYERLSRDEGVAVMRAAREAGIDFLDDARYDDESGRAPMRTGYSEVVFGELFRAAGWRREDVVVANKLWFEFWPEQDAAEELDGSLARMGFDYVDLIYAAWPPPNLGAEEIVSGVGGLLRAGKARAWGFVNWEPALIVEACAVARRTGVPLPAAAQVPYALVQRRWLEGEQESAALAESAAGVVAAFALWGGALTGKYSQGEGGRLSSQLGESDVSDAVRVGERLSELAAESGTTAAALAVAFALSGPGVASVLFGATRAEHVLENTRALAVDAQLVDEVRKLADEERSG
jgi:aryl-alcohol dehydrogenase-like predicted oxidoreductase